MHFPLMMALLVGICKYQHEDLVTIESVGKSLRLVININMSEVIICCNNHNATSRRQVIIIYNRLNYT